VAWAAAAPLAGRPGLALLVSAAGEYVGVAGALDGAVMPDAVGWRCS